MGVPRRAGYGQAATMAMFVVKSSTWRGFRDPTDAAIGSADYGSSAGPLIRYWRERYQAGSGWVRLSPLNSPSIEYSDRKQLVQGG